MFRKFHTSDKDRTNGSPPLSARFAHSQKIQPDASPSPPRSSTKVPSGTLRVVRFESGERDKLDIRDKFGKWCPAEIHFAEVNANDETERIFVHWLNSDSKYDCWMDIPNSKTGEIFAPYGFFTSAAEQSGSSIDYSVGDEVRVISPVSHQWVRGTVTFVDDTQVRVELEEIQSLKKRLVYWYSIFSGEIRPMS